MKVKCEQFESVMKSWRKLADEASTFATQIGQDRLISISVSHDAGQGVIFVWYWAKE